jgi:hypothetical protein
MDYLVQAIDSVGIHRHLIVVQFTATDEKR